MRTDGSLRSLREREQRSDFARHPAYESPGVRWALEAIRNSQTEEDYNKHALVFHELLQTRGASEENTECEPDTDPPTQKLPGRQPGTGRRSATNNPWTRDEEEALRTGVQELGCGRWKDIMNYPAFSQFFTNRSAVDLKDKWRNMCMKSASARRKAEKEKRSPPSPNLEDLAMVAAPDSRKRKCNWYWTQDEEAALRAGVDKHGEKHWKEIKKDPVFFQTLKNRTQNDMRRKWLLLVENPKRFRKVPKGSDGTYYRLWTRDETDALRAGIDRHGKKWSDIKKDPEFSQTLKNRSLAAMGECFRRKREGGELR